MVAIGRNSRRSFGDVDRKEWVTSSSSARDDKLLMEKNAWDDKLLIGAASDTGIEQVGKGNVDNGGGQLRRLGPS